MTQLQLFPLEMIIVLLNGATDTENDTTSTGDDDTATTIPTDAQRLVILSALQKPSTQNQKKTKTHKTKTFETELTKQALLWKHLHHLWNTPSKVLQIRFVNVLQ